MGVYRDEDNHKEDMEMINIADHCFLCSDPLTLPAIYWFGSTDQGSGYIWFHPKCAYKFAHKILTDHKSI